MEVPRLVPRPVGQGLVYLILRSDSDPNFHPPQVSTLQPSSPNAKGFINHTHIAHADQLKDYLEKLGPKFHFALVEYQDDNSPSRALRELPQGYVLYVTHKYHEDAQDIDGKTTTATKDPTLYHRRDYYVYGHPKGCFRSHEELLPHLIYLALGKTDLSGKCACILCCGKQLPDDVKAQGSSADADNIKRLHQTKANVRSANMNRQALLDHLTQASKERLFDLAWPIRFILRTGEIVWYDSIGSGLEWRLGVVTSRVFRDDAAEYTIQPLSNPQEHLAEIPSISEKDTRLFLAWTTPTTSDELAGMLHDDVNWLDRVNLLRQHDRNASCVIESSILAAKQVDTSHSLMKEGQVEVDLDAPETTQTHYIGMYLGTEKVWVGEAVRLRPIEGQSNRTLVFVIRQIIEKTPTATAPLKVTKKASKSKSAVSAPVASTPLNPLESTLHLVGDVYELFKSAKRATEQEQYHIGLTQQMVEDVKYLNEVERGAFSGWKVVERDVVKPLEHLAGRWYSTKYLANHLRGSRAVQEELMSGSVKDIGFDLNSRMHHAATGDKRRRDRKDALGSSVPESFRISRGLDEAAAALDGSAMDLD